MLQVLETTHMTYGSSRAFRRWCAATTLLVVSWSLPGSVYARVSPMEIVKQQLRRPNFLIMVESPESMQGIPGENPTRYNEVGADCQNGDRYCRLYGQPNRCEFSGMGGQGYKFDYVSVGTALQTQTQSETVITSTITRTQTGTGTLTDRLTLVVTSTSTTPSGATVSSTGTTTLTTSQTGSGTQTITPTVTRTATSTNTGTATPTQTQSTASTNTGTTTNTQSQSAATTNTGTTTNTQSQSQATTNTGTTTNTQSQSAATTNTGTTTNTQSQSAATTNTGTTTTTQATSNTATASQSQSQSAATTNTGTISNTNSYSGTTTNTGTTSNTNSYSGTTTNTGTTANTNSYSGTTTNTGTTSNTNSQSGTTTNTGTTANTNSYSGTTTNTGTISNTNSYSGTTTNTGTTPNTQTQSAGTTNTGTITNTQSKSSATTNTGNATSTNSYSAGTTNTANATSTNSYSAATTNTGNTTNSNSKSGSTTNTATVVPTTTYVSTTTRSSSSSGTTTDTQTTTSVTTSLYDSYTAYEIVHYSFDESNENAASDDWGNSTATGFGVGTDAAVFGAHSAQFNAGTGANTSTSTSTNNTGIYARLGAIPDFNPTGNGFTVAIWVNPNTVVGNQALITYLPSGGYDGDDSVHGDSNNGFRLMFENIANGNSHLWADANGDNTHDYVNAGGPTSTYNMTNQWNLVVVTAAGASWTVRRYHQGACTTVNGDVGAKTGAVNATIATGGSWRVGTGGISSSNRTWGFFGSLDELHMWNTVISEISMENLCACNRTDCTYIAPITSSSTSSATTTYTGSISKWSTSTASASSSQWNTSTTTSSSSQWNTSTTTSSSSQWNTTTASSSSSQWKTTTVTASQSSYATSTLSSSSSSNSTSTLTGSQSQNSTATLTGSQSRNSTATLTGSQSQNSTATLTGSQSQNSTATLTGSSSQNSTATLTGSQSQNSTATLTGSRSQNSTSTVTGSQSVSSISTMTASQSGNGTSTVTASSSTNSTATLTGSQSQNSTATLTNSSSSNATATLTSSKSANSTATVTGSQSTNSTGTMSGTQSAYSTTTVLGSATAYSTGPTTQAATATGTVSASGTVVSIVTFTDLGATETLSGTDTLTGTGTTTLALKAVPDLDNCTPSSCTWSSGVSSSYCYLNSRTPCYSNSDCESLTKGDFCRYIDTGDGSGRLRNDFCASGTTKTCRYQPTTPCNNDSQCDSGKGDYCVFGTPANMCQKTGLWCTDDGQTCATADGDACVSATSRMMMVKNAVRRVVLEHAYDDTAVVKIGQMHTYQAGNGSTDNLFPYVKLNTTSTGTSFLTSTRVDTKFLPRSELLKGVSASGKACFSSSTGPSSTCTIDYGGGGASVNTPTVTYALLSSGNDSRYAVPSGDGKIYYRQDAAWSSCGWMCYFAGAGPSGGEGIYEGSYYTFSYVFGAPVVGSPSDAAGTGSLYAPKYSTTYLGKSYGSAGNYWYLMDAERTEFLNENKYGAREFSGLSSGGAGLPWSQGYAPTGDEYPLQLTGASGDPTSTSVTCSASNGAQWDHNVVPMVNDTSLGGNSNLKPTQKALLNAARLDKASYGGFYATGNLEPIACALKNDGQNDKYHSIDNYMSIVQGNDTIANGGTSPCWENHVLLVVDGLPRGPGDVAVGGVDCSAAACVYDPVANPTLSGCNCPAVSKARALAANGINVHVIAATTDLGTRNTYAAASLNNVARAGSTSPSFINIPRYAASEDELYYWLNYEMKEALRVMVATTPASAASGSQSLAGVTAGNMLFQTTAELPEWRGSLVAFGIGTATTTTTTTATASVYTTQLAWDAATVNAFTVRGSALSDDQQKLWMQRHVFFSDATGAVHQIAVGSDGKVDSGSKTALGALGMGGNTDETERIVQWMLGKIDASDTVYHKPLNPAVMGSVVNSMPIDVGAPGTNLLPGGNRFFWDHANRPELVYLGADDGMMHAFYASNGKEAFAFIPADMVPVIAKLYAQGGQRYSPSDHIYGLAGSPKVKNLCVANCKVASNLTCSDDQTGTYDSGCPDWRTVLIMGEGPGGNHPFALDITDPVESGNPTLNDASLLWHVGYKNASGISAAGLGETDSVPAFAFHRTTNQTDNRVLMASGYPFTGSSTTAKLVDAMLWDGSTPSAAGPGATISGSGGCDSSTGQEFAVVADVAVARDNFHNGTSPADQNLLAAYVADTWGKVHQYAPSYGPALDKGGAPISLGCTQPLHFSPAVVQLNRNNSNNDDNTVYLGQVTNSILDPNTVGSSFPASMLVVAKLTSIGSAPPALDQTFGSSGLIKVVGDASLGNSNRLCGVTTVGKTSAASDCGSGGSWLPATARPTGTPVAVVRTDGTGFQLFTTWYDPPQANWDTCPESATSGNSYVTLHEFLSTGTWAQIAGREYPHQYVTGVQFVGATIFITFGTNSTTPSPTTDNFGQNFQPITSQSLSALSGDRFIKTAWTERIDAE